MDKRLKGAWLTRPYVVTLTDGSTRSVYAASQDEANERMQRHLERMGDTRKVKP